VFEYTYGYIDKKGHSYWTSGGVNGQLTDIIMNIFGVYLGVFISSRIIN